MYVYFAYVSLLNYRRDCPLNLARFHRHHPFMMPFYFYYYMFFALVEGNEHRSQKTKPIFQRHMERALNSC